jgi:CYTH domain-containing protein
LPKETERKFLIKEDGHLYAREGLYRFCSSIESLVKRVLVNGKPIRQGYMPLRRGMSLARKLGLETNSRVGEARIREKAGRFYFTLKSAGDLSRDETEQEISGKAFNEYWQYTEGRRVVKTRLELPYEDHTVEVDLYTDRDLILAEVETRTIAEAENLIPIGLDVTAVKKYKNKNLAK